MKTLGAVIACFAGIVATSCWAGTLPCSLKPRDWAALSHPSRACPTCEISPATAERLSQQAQTDLCTSRKLADDLDDMSDDEVTDAHDIAEFPKDFSAYVDTNEKQRYADLFELFIEKQVGREPKFWGHFRVGDPGFAVDMPNVFSLTKTDLPVDLSCGRSELHALHTQLGRIILMAGVEDVAETCLPRVDGYGSEALVVGAMMGVNGKLLSSSPISVSGVAGQAFEIQAPNGAIVRGRYIPVAHKLYFEMSTDVGGGAKPKQAVLRFEDSFRIVASS